MSKYVPSADDKLLFAINDTEDVPGIVRTGVFSKEVSEAVLALDAVLTAEHLDASGVSRLAMGRVLRSLTDKLQDLPRKKVKTQKLVFYKLSAKGIRNLSKHGVADRYFVDVGYRTPGSKTGMDTLAFTVEGDNIVFTLGGAIWGADFCGFTPSDSYYTKCDAPAAWTDKQFAVDELFARSAGTEVREAVRKLTGKATLPQFEQSGNKRITL